MQLQRPQVKHQAVDAIRIQLGYVFVAGQPRTAAAPAVRILFFILGGEQREEHPS